MDGEWKNYTLRDLVSLQRGHDLTDSERRPGSVPVMGSAGQNGFHDTFKVKGPGIAIGRSGASFGQVHYCRSDFWPHNTTLYVTDFRGNHPRFVYYLLGQIDFTRFNSGSAQPSLNRNLIYSMPIRYPCQRQQQAIASILGALDDKIELNRQRNRTLEAMARALFQSWFVDFDPVKAKAAGKQPPGLKPEIAALFPDSFEETEVGVVPQGWQVAPIRDLCTNVENGGTPSRDVPDYWKPEQIPWLTSGEVRQNIVTSTQGFISRKGLENSSAKLWPPYTTVVALYGATAGCTTILASEVSANQACCGLLPVPHARFYVHQSLLKSIDFLRQQASGSAQQNLSQSIVGNLMILRPSEDVLSSFDKLTAGMYDKCIQSAHEIRLLSSLRDTLLPKLISGELRIPDAERIVARTI